MTHGHTLHSYRSTEAIEATIQLLHDHSRNGAVMYHTLNILDRISTEFLEYKDLVNHSLGTIPREKWQEIRAACVAFES